MSVCCFSFHSDTRDNPGVVIPPPFPYSPYTSSEIHPPSLSLFPYHCFHVCLSFHYVLSVLTRIVALYEFSNFLCHLVLAYTSPSVPPSQHLVSPTSRLGTWSFWVEWLTFLVIQASAPTSSSVKPFPTTESESAPLASRYPTCISLMTLCSVCIYHIYIFVIWYVFYSIFSPMKLGTLANLNPSTINSQHQEHCLTHGKCSRNIC